MDHPLEPPRPKELREARDRFNALLQQADSKEATWQELFAQCPYILSESLPLRLSPEDIRPLGRPGLSEPDFIFYPRIVPRRHQSYGVIELKTPRSTILTRPRKRIVTLSRTADTAVAQARVYLEQLASTSLITRPDEILFLGARRYAFIIMGLTAELRDKVASDFIGGQLCKLLPLNFQIVPYDLLYTLFSATLPPRLMLLLPAPPDAHDDQTIGPYGLRFESTRTGVKAGSRAVVQWMAVSGVREGWCEHADDGSFDIRQIMLGRRWTTIESFVAELRTFMQQQGLNSRLGMVWRGGGYPSHSTIIKHL